MSLPDSSGVAITLMWVVTLILSGVVAVVLIGLLSWIVHEARVILGTVGEIRTAGQNIASSTAKVSYLRPINDNVSHILSSAGNLAGSVAAIDEHAMHCGPGCPLCLGKGGA